jgi:hypothetical protein
MSYKIEDEIQLIGVRTDHTVIAKEIESYFKRNKDEYYEKFSASYEINAQALQKIKKLEINFTVKEHVYYKNLATEKNIEYVNYIPYGSGRHSSNGPFVIKKYSGQVRFLNNFVKSFSILYDWSRTEAVRRNPDWSNFDFASSTVFYNHLERHVFDIFLIETDEMIRQGSQIIQGGL